MPAAEKMLVWFLRFSAIMFLCAIPFVFAPTSWMHAISEWQGVELPETPLVQYLTRHLSALYASMGASYWYMSRDVKRHLPLLRFSVPVMAVFDVAILLVDVAASMPPSWIAGEAASIIPWTIALWWLVRRVEESNCTVLTTQSQRAQSESA